MQGNVMDMAVGIVIGAAFTAIVTSLVDDLINPIIGLFCGANFADLQATFFDGAVTLKYGSFIMAVINFIIIAIVVFILLKIVNNMTARMKKNKEEEAPTVKTCEFCQSEIPIAATRCPMCTSLLAENVDMSAE